VTDKAPQMLGKYRVLEEIGRGGFGVVYKAVDTSLRDRPVALKVMHPNLLGDPGFVQRFHQEAGVAANLDHPSIVPVYEIGEVEGTLFIAMKYIPGRSLEDILAEEGALPFDRVIHIAEQLASALDYAHDRGFIHRDVKPGNTLVTEDARAFLTDFGLVKAAEATMLTTMGHILGTSEYMSPEQAEPNKEQPIGRRTDQYSLAVVVFHMLTGEVPFRGPTTLAVLRGHADKDPPRPSEINAELAQSLDAPLLQALAKRPQDRWESCGHFIASLRSAVLTSVPTIPPARPMLEEPEDIRTLAVLVTTVRPAPGIPYLESLDRPAGVVYCPLTQPVTTIGRDPVNDLVIDEPFVGWPTVSRNHSRIERDGGDFVVVDLESQNGVYVNNQRTGENLLRDGDVVNFGKVQFAFRLKREGS